jgi:CubicO group peptidase (beta-lactamase class C family)
MSIKEVMDQVDFSGVLALSLDGEEYYYERGFRLERESLPNNDDTLFNIASGTKWFTALSIFKLIEQEKLSFDSLVSELLDLPFQVNKNMTVKHLLHHTSGISDYFDEDIMDDFDELFKTLPMYELNRISDILPAFKDISYFEPGEKVKYSNGGYVVLGLIVEAVSKISYQDFVKENILKPLGISRSGAYSLDKLPANTALGNIETEDGNKTFIYSIPKVSSSDGGLFLNARDCFKMWHSLINNKILKEDLTQRFFNDHILEEDNFYFGFGMYSVRNNDEVERYSISGYDPGSQFVSWYFPKQNVITAVFANNENDLGELHKEIKQFVLDK